jgi:hypothetical protein
MRRVGFYDALKFTTNSGVVTDVRGNCCGRVEQGHGTNLSRRRMNFLENVCQ